MSRYTYEVIDIDRLTSIDLYHEAHLPADDDCIAARVTIFDPVRETPYPERAEVILYPSYRRAGIAWGADADWTDADSIEDALDRYLGEDGKEMENDPTLNDWR